MCKSRVFIPLVQVLPARLKELCDLIIFHEFSPQSSLMPLDGAFLHSISLPPRNQSRFTGQYDLPQYSAQQNAYTPDSGPAYPRDMPAPRMIPHTMDPSRLLYRQSPMPAIQAESASESELDMDNGGDSNRLWDGQSGDDDAAGWARHPDTVELGAPDFYEAKIKGDMRDSAGVRVPVTMHARFVLKKKAARQRNFWIIYRRNYFGVQGSYDLKPLRDLSTNETLYLYRDKYKPEPIRALFMCMRGVVESDEGPEIKIVVFNAKRKPLHEGKEPPPIQPQRMKPLTEGSTKHYVDSTGNRLDHLNVPMNHTFHRNQFRAATQNNGARRTEQQFYHILLELKAEVIVQGVPKLFTVASKMSKPLVVRGRCPLSFKKRDKDGPTHQPDCKGRKRPRDGGGNGGRRCLKMQSQKEGQAKGANRGSCNKTRVTSRRSTQASSIPPSLTCAGSRSTNTNPMSPVATPHGDGTVNKETIPRLDRKLLTLTRECCEGDPPWLESYDST